MLKQIERERDKNRWDRTKEKMWQDERERERSTKMQQYSPSMVLVQLGCIISQKFSATLGSTTLAEAYHFLATTLIMPLDTSRIPNLGLRTCIILDRRLRLVCRFKLETRGSSCILKIIQILPGSVISLHSYRNFARDRGNKGRYDFW